MIEVTQNVTTYKFGTIQELEEWEHGRRHNVKSGKLASEQDTPGRRYRPWSREEDQRLTLLWGTRMSTQDIANVLNRTPDGVGVRASRLRLDRKPVTKHRKRNLGHGQLQRNRERMTRINRKAGEIKQATGITYREALKRAFNDHEGRKPEHQRHTCTTCSQPLPNAEQK